MNYEKITLAKFSERLAAGKYAAVAGARRAIGKSEWSEADKNKARALVDKKFGVDSSAKPAKAAKGPKAPKAPKAVKKAAAAKTPKAPKPAKDPKAPKAPRGRPRKNTQKAVAVPAESPRLTEIRLTADSIRSASEGLKALAEVQSRLGSDQSEVHEAISACTTIIRRLGTLMEGGNESVALPHANGVAFHAEESDDGLFAKQPDPV